MQLRDIEQRINAFKSILEIVNAMKAFAGVNYRKAEEIIHALRIFEENLYKGLGLLLYFYPELKFEEGIISNRVIIAFGSDQGFCGVYNWTIAENLSKLVREGDCLIVVGKRLYESSREFNISSPYFLNAAISVEGVRDSLERLMKYLLELFPKITIAEVYTAFILVKEGRALFQFSRLLPPDIRKIRIPQNLITKPLFYLNQERLLKKFLEELIFIGLYRAYLEALRSEAWYRIKTMEDAIENTQKKIFELSVARNYQRQEMITTEILEIITGQKF